MTTPKLTTDFSTLEAIRIALRCAQTPDQVNEWDEMLREYMTMNHPTAQLLVNRKLSKVNRYPGRLSQWTVRSEGRVVRIRGVIAGGGLRDQDIDIDLCEFLIFADCEFVDVETMPRLQQILGIHPTVFYPALFNYYDEFLPNAQLKIEPVLETMRQFTLAFSRSESVISVVGAQPELGRFIDVTVLLCDFIERVDLPVTDLLGHPQQFAQVLAEIDEADRDFLDRIDANVGVQN